MKQTMRSRAGSAAGFRAASTAFIISVPPCPSRDARNSSASLRFSPVFGRGLSKSGITSFENPSIWNVSFGFIC